MNKFLNRKKTPDGVATSNEEAYNALSSPPPTPGIKKSATSRWKKTKKAADPMPELNIAAALPASDDFRTSLLMPNLSARFSMLREQDDPTSLLGKASDDSVLQPRRRSRMLDYGFGSNGLNDIAEVQSINSSIRPPFAYSRQESYGSEDGYGSENESTHNGSMLARARPGEGNVLFGGRQKVYKIALSGATSTKLGKAVYEDDIGKSAFQKYRKEKEGEDGRRSEEDQGFDFGLDQVDKGDQDDTHTATPNDSAKDLSHSPSLSSYDRKRSTTSSTARSEARSSTAATSIASQPAASAPLPLAIASQAPTPAPMPPLKRSDTKTRRLYDQGLDQHIQEQQTSALTRLNSIQRQRSQHHKPSPPFLQSAKSANNIYEQTKQPVYALRAQSPPLVSPLAPLSTFGSMRKPNSNNASPIASGPQSPTSPQAMDFDDATPLTEALDPNDRGKATAMGAFNKPAQQFDEKQYLERQQQLQRTLSKPGMRKDPSTFQQRIGRFEHLDRDRSTSDASTRSRSRSAPKAPPKSIPKRGDSLRKRHEPTQAYSVFQNAANQMPTKPGAQQYDTHRTFFGNISASDSEEEEDDQLRDEDYQNRSDYAYGATPGRWQPTPLPSVSEHPALRGHASKPSLAEEDEDLEPRPLRPTASSLSLRTDAQRPEAPLTDVVDSPTLGPSSSEPLNGMVHHLRQKSNGSSLYPNDEDFSADQVPELPDMRWNAKSPDSGHPALRNTMDSDSRIESTYTNSNPWDLDEFDNAYYTGDAEDRSSISPIGGGRSQGAFASRAPSIANVPGDRQSEVSQYSDMATGPTWQNELRKQHTRDASTATQQERDAFANELAARRNAIQENIKSIVERDNPSRNVSPAPSASGAFKAFGMLRSKSSRESVDIGRGPSAPTKAMKMLGIGANTSTTTLSSQYERSGPSFDVSRARGDSGSRLPPLPTALPREPFRARGDSETSKADRQHPGGPSPATSNASRARSRSNSEVTTGRARSRTGPYRDDLEKAMVEGMGSSAAGHPNLSPMIPVELTPKASPEIVQSQFDSEPRARSNSRPPVISNYFDSKSLHPIQTASQSRLAAAGPSAVTLSPNVYTPAGGSARPSPAVSPITQNPTPPLSGANTPMASTFTPPPNMPIIQPRSGVLRKKTISKMSISEPTLISSTSNVDTVDLPEGASLKNGMDSPPPVPPINPKRRATRKVFGLARSGVSDDAQNYGNHGRSKTPDPWMSRVTPEPDFSVSRAVRQASDGRPGIHPQQGFENHSTPALLQYGVPQPAGSPERVERSPVPQHHAAMEGGMF
ncbi:hypothetical protein LTR36_006643 [Oleoguttula mirabilis]|uniref:Uncharacterized protein n=1 Tax=Oleoguttula mirabilis TaxID=1507867 RepID=A0AAV9JDX1_9PEZI|nr:hypothetical protein LTR36_006643 [Oleoguttula mirabilis]